jgi:hypothetical protein
VAALAALQQNMQVKTDRSEGWYEVTLSIRDAATPAAKETVDSLSRRSAGGAEEMDPKDSV